MAALRSRLAALTDALFSSKIRVELRSTGDDVRLNALSVSLDGGVVYTAPEQAFFQEPELVYEHAVAPGLHVLGVQVERQDRRGAQYSTWQVSRFVVLVPEGRQLSARVELEDDSSMAADFPEDQEGQYELSVKLRVEAEE